MSNYILSERPCNKRLSESVADVLELWDLPETRLSLPYRQNCKWSTMQLFVRADRTLVVDVLDGGTVLDIKQAVELREGVK